MKNNLKHKKVISIMLTLILTLGFVGFNNDRKIMNASATGGGGGSEETVSNDDMTISKTAKVNSWDNRTYDVTLTAAAKEETVIVDPNPSDIILILDRSGSMAEELVTVTYTPITGQPNTNKNYYILRNGNYTEVQHGPTFYGPTTWYYGNYFSWTSVSYSPGGTGANNQYEFFTRTETRISKIQSLKNAANSFVNTVKEKSPDSRIGVVSFANNGTTDTNRNNRSLLRVGNVASYTEITRAINALSPNGATRSDYGFDRAKELYDAPSKFETVNNNSNRDKLIIFFTDGVPTTSSDFSDSVAAAAISRANTLKGAPYNTSIYSIGIFQNITGDTLTRVENYMRSVASDKAGGGKHYYKVESSEELLNLFDSITQVIGGALENVYIKDYIDPRFRVLDNNGNIITNTSATVNLSNGGVVRYDSTRNLWYVQWTLATLTKTGVTKTIKVMALDQFIGGNDITTNEEGSGVYYGEESLLYPKPMVNVKPRITVNNKEETIFLGERVPTAGLPDSMYNNASLDPFVGKPATGSFSIEWLDVTNSLGNDLTQLGNQAPEEDHEYTLKVIFTPNPVEFPKSTENTSGNVAAMVTAQGIYKIKVQSGKITVNKVVLDKDGNAIAIPRGDTFAVKVGGPLETYLDLLKDDSTKVLNKLKAGRYTLSEILPKEYQLVSIRINGTEVDKNNAFVDINKNNPEAVVVITNKQEAKPFFHGTDRVVNRVKMN
ncbi:MAG: VWA domain-containing protein [Clostridiaceae bacterium]